MSEKYNEFEHWLCILKDKLNEEKQFNDFTKRELWIIKTIREKGEEIEVELYNSQMAYAINTSGGCSVCGDLDGYSCICEDDEAF